MSIWEKVLSFVDATKAALHGLDVIGVISSSSAYKASEALAAISGIVEVVKEGLTGKTSPDLVMAEIKSLHDKLAANDAEADAALDAKFPKEQRP